MTLNELIKDAKENGVDFDATILCKNEDQMGTDVSDAEFDFSGGQILVANENFNHYDSWWDNDDEDDDDEDNDDEDNDDKDDDTVALRKCCADFLELWKSVEH